MADREQLIRLLEKAGISYSIKYRENAGTNRYVVLDNDQAWRDKGAELPETAWAGMMVVFEFDEAGTLVHAYATE